MESPRHRLDVLRRAGHALWQTDRTRIAQTAASAADFLRRQSHTTSARSGSTLSETVLDRDFQEIDSRFDAVNGGFSEAPKFPVPVLYGFLFRLYTRTGESLGRDHALFTLRKMAVGGIHDVVGGGFHRYSTDARWHVPHFEKMLYDQAQLAIAYTEAYQITHDPEFAEVARDILEYVGCDMTGNRGQFFSAEDADSRCRAARNHAKERSTCGHAARSTLCLATTTGAFFPTTMVWRTTGTWSMTPLENSRAGTRFSC